MSKLWLIALNEYKKNVFKRSFIFVLLSVPVFIGLLLGMGFYFASFEKDVAPIGYVDHAGFLVDALPGPVDDNEEAIEIIAFKNVDIAQQALDANNIQAYFILAED